MADFTPTQVGMYADAANTAPKTQDQIASANASLAPVSAKTPAQLAAGGANTDSSYVPPTAASVTDMQKQQNPAYTGTAPSGGITLDQINNLINGTTPGEQKAQGEMNTTEGNLQSLMDKLGTQGSEEARLSGAAGLPDMQKTLSDLNATISSTNAQLGQTKLDAEGRLAPMFSQNAQINAADRAASAKLLGLSAAATAIQGNIANAQTRVAAAIKAEFDPITAHIKYWSDVLTQNRDDMTAAQKAKADAISTTLKEYDTQVAQQKTDKAAVYTVLLDAAKGGADAQTIANIQAAPDQASAIAAAGKYLTSGSAAKTQVVEVNGRRVLINSDTGQSVKDLGEATGVTKPSASERTASSLANFGKVFVPGAKMADGTPLVDTNGYITPIAWKAAIADAPAEGLTRTQFIKEFGSQLYTKDGSSFPGYGLTPQEEKLITGTATPTPSGQ